MNGDFPPIAKNEVTQILQTDELKKRLARNNEAKMVLYNALPKKEYERIFMCKTTKDIWESLLITHQGNSQVKDNKVDHLVQQYEQFTILEEESIDSILLDLTLLLLVLKLLMKVFLARTMLGGKKERVKSIALKAKKESSDDETSSSESDDEEYAMAVRNFKKFFRRKGKFVRQPRKEKKSFRQRDDKKDQKAFVGSCWSDSENKADDKTNDETCLMAQSSNEVTLDSSHYSDNASSFDEYSMQN
ncbi:hypothetical protein Tco_1575902 [Tanacetum coccineum]